MTALTGQIQNIRIAVIAQCIVFEYVGKERGNQSKGKREKDYAPVQVFVFFCFFLVVSCRLNGLSLPVCTDHAIAACCVFFSFLRSIVI